MQQAEWMTNIRTIVTFQTPDAGSVEKAEAALQRLPGEQGWTHRVPDLEGLPDVMYAVHDGDVRDSVEAKLHGMDLPPYDVRLEGEPDNPEQ